VTYLVPAVSRCLEHLACMFRSGGFSTQRSLISIVKRFKSVTVLLMLQFFISSSDFSSNTTLIC